MQTRKKARVVTPAAAATVARTGDEAAKGTAARAGPAPKAPAPAVARPRGKTADGEEMGVMPTLTAPAQSGLSLAVRGRGTARGRGGGAARLRAPSPPQADDDSEDAVEGEGDMGISGMVAQPATGRLGGVLEEDCSDDDDGPHVTPPSFSTCQFCVNAMQCLADILPATQRVRSNAAMPKARPIVATRLQQHCPHICRAGCHVHRDCRRPAPVFIHEQGYPQKGHCRPQGQGPPRWYVLMAAPTVHATPPLTRRQRMLSESWARLTSSLRWAILTKVGSYVCAWFRSVSYVSSSAIATPSRHMLLSHVDSIFHLHSCSRTAHSLTPRCLPFTNPTATSGKTFCSAFHILNIHEINAAVAMDAT